MYLIPEPKSAERREGSFFIGYDTHIVIDGGIRENAAVYAGILKKCMIEWTGVSAAVIKGAPGKGDIYLKQNPKLDAQEYRLLITSDGITAEGGDGAAILYAAETLCQMIEQCGCCLECIDIHDYPSIRHRGYYLDESRGRVLKLDYLKETVDRLCRYKINEFQLYIEHTYMLRDFSEMWRDETPLLAEEIMDLDRYCRERHVELIPSLASFGHLYTLLGTKSHADLCELEDSEKQPFSFWQRMLHHTVNVADDRTLPLIKGMLEEYMALFSSNKFNLCGDETFDLGKGKSKPLADKSSVHRIYIDYIKDICTFLVKKGKQPMFWGDVICEAPELVRELPEETICLTWGYDPDQSGDASHKMAQTGVKQYLCPGVCGWNQWMNLVEDSYRNITRMCSYAREDKAMGILNTDWGDCGHVNDPRFSIPGMIYGAAFSWSDEILSFDEINRRISAAEYHDSSKQFVSLAAQISAHSRFQWWDAMMYYEKNRPEAGEGKLPEYAALPSPEETDRLNAELDALRRELKKTVAHMDSRSRCCLQEYDAAAVGIGIWNEIGACLSQKEAGQEWEQGRRFALAERLENWFMAYKTAWRDTSREGDLPRVAEIIFWYADLLRGRERMNKIRY